MTQFQKISLFLLRISLGWLFFYAGITKIMNPAWSAAGYLNNAKTFPEFYHWLASPSILPLTNLLNEWGLALIGISLILGVFVRLASLGGFAMMILYYFPVLAFPYPDANSFIVDDHIVYSAIFLVLFAYRAGRIYGLEDWCANLPICRSVPGLRGLLG